MDVMGDFPVFRPDQRPDLYAPVHPEVFVIICHGIALPLPPFGLGSVMCLTVQNSSLRMLSAEVSQEPWKDSAAVRVVQLPGIIRMSQFGLYLGNKTAGRAYNQPNSIRRLTCSLCD